MITAQAEGVARINSIQHTNLIPHICILMRKNVECFWQVATQKTVKTRKFWIFTALVSGEPRSVSGFASISINLHANEEILLVDIPAAFCLFSPPLFPVQLLQFTH